MLCKEVSESLEIVYNSSKPFFVKKIEGTNTTSRPADSVLTNSFLKFWRYKSSCGQCWKIFDLILISIYRICMSIYNSTIVYIHFMLKVPENPKALLPDSSQCFPCKSNF